MFLRILIAFLCVWSVSSQVEGPLGDSAKKSKELPIDLTETKELSLEVTKNELIEIVPNDDQIVPSLQIVLIVHPYNKFNELPFVLSGIEDQNYPKHRINVLIQTEIYEQVHSGQYDVTVERFKYNDLTVRMLKSWKQSVELKYHKFELKLRELEDDEEDTIDYWSTDRYRKLMNLKSYGFNYALQEWADYCVLQDADVILSNPNTFRTVLKQESIIYSPTLLSLSLYSNFWAGIDENGYYKRTENYVPILERQKVGTFKVPMIYSLVFVNLRNERARNLKFKFKDLENFELYKDQLNKIPFDDLIVFAKSAQALNLSFFVNNEEIYGFLMPPIDKLDLAKQKQNLIDLELECLVENENRFKVSNDLESYRYRSIDKSLSERVEKIYVINLERRKERKKYMSSACDHLRLDCEFVKAVDGQLINKQYLIENKIQVMKGYLDPFHKRPMTHGEIGCFMSHYNIWLDVIKNNYSWSIVFKDDVRFEKDFHTKFNEMIDSLDDLDKQIDFIYLGRKREGKPEEESWANKHLVKPTYSYWTIGYLISANGARKLVDSKQLEKLIPVDEFLPVMYDRHPNQNWTQHFEKRNLVALSVHPLLVQPMHYVGEDQYVSDTEDSIKLNENSVKDEL